MKAELIKRNIKKEFNGWWIISLVGAVVILLPILFIFSSIFLEPNENWLHIRQYLLKNYVANTLILVVSTSIFTAFLGVTLAWLIAAYDFPQVHRVTVSLGYTQIDPRDGPSTCVERADSALYYESSRRYYLTA